jgi:DNA-binding MarR family transcriptional regulator
LTGEAEIVRIPTYEVRSDHRAPRSPVGRRPGPAGRRRPQLDWQSAENAGLSPTQADILRFVANRPEGARLTAAAAHVGVRKATASDAVTALERKALISKHADASDGRAVALKATAKGDRVAQSWPSSFAPIVAGLSETEQEALLGLVVKMIRQLQQRQIDRPAADLRDMPAFPRERGTGHGDAALLRVRRRTDGRAAPARRLRGARIRRLTAV